MKAIRFVRVALLGAAMFGVLSCGRIRRAGGGKQLPLRHA